MEIRVGGYLAASFLLEREPNEWHALVVLDSGTDATDFLAAQARSHLCLRFDDVEEARGNRLLPTGALIDQGLRFARGKDRLLVACRAGQGRSVALAYLVGCREHGAAQAVRLLDPTRHRPNRLVVRLGAVLLDMPDALDQFDGWRRRHADVRLSDYDDEREREFEALEAQGAANKVCVGGAGS